MRVSAIYDGTGHALHSEEPERFAADIAAFVGSLGSVAHGAKNRASSAPTSAGASS